MDVHKWIECALLINVPITIFESCRYQLTKSQFFLHPAQLISNNVGYLSAEVAKFNMGLLDSLACSWVNVYSPGLYV